MSDKVHNLKKDYVVQIMNGYDNNEEMPVDTRSQKILRARLAFLTITMKQRKVAEKQSRL